MKDKKASIIFWALLIIVIATTSPIFINECYKQNKGYITLWEAKDFLSYFGAVISSIGALFIGVVAFKQNEKANDINERLLRIEEINSTPFLHIDALQSVIQNFSEHEVDMLIAFKNETNSVINIINVSDINIELLLPGVLRSIPFCRNWTKHYSILPHQSRQMNFYIESKRTEHPIINDFLQIENAGFCYLQCSLEIKIQFVNSRDTYIQKYEFPIRMYKKPDENKFKFIIEGIENTITMEEK